MRRDFAEHDEIRTQIRPKFQVRNHALETPRQFSVGSEPEGAILLRVSEALRLIIASFRHFGADHRVLREKPRPEGRGGIAGRASASLWDRTYCEITDRGAPPHDAAK